MKLLVVLSDLDIGGAQNYTISLMNEFVKMGHSVSLRVLSDKTPLKSRLDKDIEIEIWPRKTKLDFDVLSKIRKEIKLTEYNGIISSYPIYLKLATFFTTNVPTTIYPIHTTIDRNKKAFFINYIAYRIKRKNEIYLTSIDSQTQYLVNNYNLKNGYFEQIYNGINLQKFTYPPSEFNRNKFLGDLGINPEHRIILMVAGFREEKRHIDAIDAFRLLQMELSNISLVFVGDNRINERDELLQYISSKNIKNIKILSASEAGDVRNYYWVSDLFTLSSNKVETFPISALEAMASGLPCLLTNIGGARDFIIQDLNGRLCLPNNPLDIKTNWKIMLDNYNKFNKDTIRNFVIERYSLTTSAEEYINLIENSIEQRN